MLCLESKISIVAFIFPFTALNCVYFLIFSLHLGHPFVLYIQGGSNMTGTDLCVNKPHCAAAVRP